MDAIVPYAIWAVLILVGLGVLTLVLFGIRSVTYGKIKPISILIVVVPFLLLFVLGFATDDWTYAAIITTLVMMTLGLVAVVVSGVRSMTT